MKSACVGVLSIIELKIARWNIEIRKMYYFNAATKWANLDPAPNQPQQPIRSNQAQYCLYLYTNNVQLYEISTSKHLHILLSILFSVYNLTMVNWGPKHVVVIAFLPTLFN